MCGLNHLVFRIGQNGLFWINVLLMKHISRTKNQACVCREVSSMRQMTHSRSQNGWGCHFHRKHVVLLFDACRASFWVTIIFAFIANMMLLIWWACVLRNKIFLNAKCLGKFLYLISKYKKYWQRRKTSTDAMVMIISIRH